MTNSLRQAKGEIIKFIKTEANTVTLEMVGKLLDCLIEEIHYDNEIAEGSDFLRNQGAIKQCRKILEIVRAKNIS